MGYFVNFDNEHSNKMKKNLKNSFFFLDMLFPCRLGVFQILLVNSSSNTIKILYNL
jgi:hypothetical protein